MGEAMGVAILGMIIGAFGILAVVVQELLHLNTESLISKLFWIIPLILCWLFLMYGGVLIMK